MLLDQLKDYKIVLASSSPRRRELLASLGIDFRLASNIEFDENYPPGIKLQDIPLFLAEKKSLAYPHLLENDEILITADTIVVNQDAVLEKPIDEKHAFRMLKSLSGRNHFVYTGVYIRSGNNKKGFVTSTEVCFAILSEDEIWHYIKQYKPFDKAGSYGIQEWIGYVAVEQIKGSYFNVMGLPVHQIYKELKHFINK